MTAVREELDRVLADAVRKHGVVAWLDPERAFADVAQSVAVSDAKLCGFEGSFYELQHRLLDLLDAESRPKLVVYLPGVATLTGTPLLELGAMGGTLTSDLKKIAKSALAKIHMPKARIDALLGTPNLSLDMVESAIAVEIGVPEALRAIFAGASNEDLVFRVFDDPNSIRDVEQAGVTDVLARYLGTLLATTFPAEPVALVDAVWERVLVTEFVSDLARGTTVPAQAAERASTDLIVQKLCHKIAERLRQGVHRHDDYRNRSRAIAERLGLETALIEAPALGSIDTFEFEEQRLLAWAVDRTLAGDATTARELIAKRKGSFWLRTDPRRQAAWSAAELATELVERAEQFRVALPSSTASAATWVTFYVEGASGSPALADLDSLARRAERQLAVADARDLVPLIDRARAAYQGVVQITAERFADAIARGRGEALADLPKQSRVFHERVEPLLGSEPVAYVLCDALRYEMAADLRQRFAGEKGVTVTLDARIATLPTVTEIGMTALLPGAERGLELLATGGKLGLRIGDAAIFDKPGRVALLESRFGSKVKVADLDEYVASLRTALPSSKKRGSTRPRRDLPALLVAFWGDIDSMGEHGKLEPLRTYLSELVDRLARLVRELGDAGFRHIVLASDHGHVFTEMRGKEMEIDPPLGTPLDAQRRHWVGRVAKVGPDHVRLAASDVGMGGDLDLVFPRGLAAMRFAKKVFFHGGISLQELIIPAMTVTFPVEERDKDGRRFYVHLDEDASVSPSGLLMGQLEYTRTSLLDEKTAEVQVVGTVDGRVVTRLASAAGSTPGTDLVTLTHGRRSLFCIEVRGPRSGRLKVELRTRDGGRLLNAAQPPPELEFALTERAKTPHPAPPGVTAVPATSISLEIGTASEVVDLGFAPTNDERRILEALARDGIGTELTIGKLLGKKGASFLMAALIQKLLERGHRFVEQGDDGDEGATYRFHKHKLRRSS